MRRPALAFLLLLAVMRAQDVPPPPKPADNGPSLDVTMQFIADKIGSLGKVSYVAFLHNTKTGEDSSTRLDYEIVNMTPNVEACWLSYHWKVFSKGYLQQDLVGGFSLGDVHDVRVEPMESYQTRRDAQSGNPEIVTTSTTPPVAALLVNRTDGKSNFFPFLDSTLADRAAKAITHAVELCGGGGKEPF